MTILKQRQERLKQRQEQAIPVSESSGNGGSGHVGKHRLQIGLLLERWALVALLVVTFVTFATYGGTSDTFLSTVNIRNVLGEQAVVGVLAAGSLLPLVAREFDL